MKVFASKRMRGGSDFPLNWKILFCFFFCFYETANNDAWAWTMKNLCSCEFFGCVCVCLLFRIIKPFHRFCVFCMMPVASAVHRYACLHSNTNMCVQKLITCFCCIFLFRANFVFIVQHTRHSRKQYLMMSWCFGLIVLLIVQSRLVTNR